MTEIEIKKEGKTIERYLSASEKPLTESICMTERQTQKVCMAEKRPQKLETALLNVAFHDYSYPHFGIQVEQFHTAADCQFSSKCEVEPIMGFCLLTQGHFSAKTSLFRNPEFNWQVGSANIVLRNGMGAMDMSLPKNEAVEMLNFIIPQDYIQTLITKDPQTFEQLDKYTQTIDNGTLFKENHLVNTQVLRAARDIHKCRMMGNMAPIYLETKITECLAGMLAPSGSEKESFHLSLIIRDKIHDVKDIIHSHYQDLPSLHQLASMVGTNECTLKKAFKQEFGTTVFQYLFEFRMNLAVQYLLDSTLSIAEIGIKLGYDYQSHFCTAFKRKFGVSPMEFRMKRIPLNENGVRLL